MKYKLILRDMAIPLSKGRTSLDNQSDAFKEHFTKICIWKDETYDLNGWLRTLGVICAYVGNLEVKTKSGKLSEKDYKDYFFNVESYSDIRSEYYRILIKFKIKTKPLKEDFVNYFDIYNKLKDLLIPLFTSNEDYDDDYYKNLLTDFFNNNL